MIVILSMPFCIVQGVKQRLIVENVIGSKGRPCIENWEGVNHPDATFCENHVFRGCILIRQDEPFPVDGTGGNQFFSGPSHFFLIKRIRTLEERLPFFPVLTCFFPDECIQITFV